MKRLTFYFIIEDYQNHFGFCNEFTFYDHWNIERDIEVNHKRG